MTSSLIETEAVEEIVQSGLPTRALELLIDAEDASMVDLYGAHGGERTVTLRGTRVHRQQQSALVGVGSPRGTYRGGYTQVYGEWRVYLPYPWALTVAQVQEYTESQDESDAVMVDASDWALELGGRAVRRLDRPWRAFVALRYTPIDDLAKRRGLLVDLVKLRARYDAVRQTSVGPAGAGVTVSHLDYPTERRKLLHSLMPWRPGSTMA